LDTSNPEGAVTVRLAVKPLPDTVNDCAADGVPTVVLNADGEPESVIEAVVPETATVLLSAPVLLAVTFPEYDPAEVPVKRT